MDRNRVLRLILEDSRLQPLVTAKEGQSTVTVECDTGYDGDSLHAYVFTIHPEGTLE